MIYLYKKQKVLSIREQFTYFDINQQVVYNATGSFFAFPKRYELTQTGSSHPLLEVRRKMFTLLPRFYVNDLRNQGQLMAVIRQRFTFMRPTFDLYDRNDQRYHVQGSFWAHNYQIFDPSNNKVIEVNKKWIAWGDTYEIMIDDSKIDLLLAIGLVLAIDCAIFSNRSNR
jgi:uncharacterized protein YxjI